MTKEQITSIHNLIDALSIEHSDILVKLEIAKIQGDKELTISLATKVVIIHKKIINLLRVIYE